MGEAAQLPRLGEVGALGQVLAGVLDLAALDGAPFGVE